MPPRREVRARHSPQYALETLQALPCGCVAAVYRAQPLDIEVVSLEARGPHCLYVQHKAGRLLGVGAQEPDRLSSR
jgi:hypothetical protein